MRFDKKVLRSSVFLMLFLFLFHSIADPVISSIIYHRPFSLRFPNKSDILVFLSLGAILYLLQLWRKNNQLK